ncbi:MAG: hotdog domain-containing protein [Desulfarculaceae bacterium]|jgi:predicted thioesterase
MRGIRVGLSGEASLKVAAKDLASAFGNPGVDVLSSMTLMTLLEQACLACIENHLEASQFSVGSRMEMDHLAPTPEGFEVKAQAELGQVKGRKLIFSVKAHDGQDEIARARHVRYLVDKESFLKSVAEKADRGGD